MESGQEAVTGAEPPCSVPCTALALGVAGAAAQIALQNREYLLLQSVSMSVIRCRWGFCQFGS